MIKIEKPMNWLERRSQLMTYIEEWTKSNHPKASDLINRIIADEQIMMNDFGEQNFKAGDKVIYIPSGADAEIIKIENNEVYLQFDNDTAKTEINKIRLFCD